MVSETSCWKRPTISLIVASRRCERRLDDVVGAPTMLPSRRAGRRLDDVAGSIFDFSFDQSNGPTV